VRSGQSAARKILDDLAGSTAPASGDATTTAAAAPSGAGR